MKRNMVPLLGIAFVVAIICTGVFYGLFADKLHSKPTDIGHPIVVAARDLDRGTVLKPGDLRTVQVPATLAGSFSKVEDADGSTLLDPIQKNEPLLQRRVASANPNASESNGGIATGMRAVSIRIAESSGLMGLVHTGSRIDIQAVSDHNGTSELRTILQNIEVLRVNPQLEPVGNNRPPVPVATVLVPAQYADLIALADSAAKIRLALRNPVDDATSSRRAMSLAAVFGGVSEQTPTSVPAVAAVGRRSDRQIALHVQVLDASSVAVSELHSKLAESNQGDPLHVSTFRDADGGRLVQKLILAHELEVVSNTELAAGEGRSTSVHAGNSSCRMRVQFSSTPDSTGKLSLRVHPEVSLRQNAGVETRVYDAALPETSSFLVTGLFAGASDSGVLSRLYPGHVWAGRELIIFVSAAPRPVVPSPSLAQSSRRR